MSAYDAEDLYDEDLINEIENQKHSTSSNNNEDYIPDDLFQDQETTSLPTKKRLSDDGGANVGGNEKKTRIEDPTTSQKKNCLADYFTKPPPPAPSPSIPSTYGHSSTGPDVPEESAPTCQCGTQCLKKTVVKEGPNKGRPFWSCPNGGPGTQAHLFEWCGEGTKPDAGTSVSHDGNGIVPPVIASTGAGPPCKCGQASVQRTVQKEGPNKNRLFYTCPLPQGSQCGFFEWITLDQPTNANGPSKTLSNYGAGGGGYGNGSSQYGQGGGQSGSQGAMGSGGGGGTMFVYVFLSTLY